MKYLLSLLVSLLLLIENGKTEITGLNTLSVVDISPQADNFNGAVIQFTNKLLYVCASGSMFAVCLLKFSHLNDYLLIV